ncbi:Microtubule-associated protein 70-5 [Acorus calamus]|uniref:cysteine synthase n=1 Tax=Acorus calamus TaxID=4465 RepID=A0AAV9DCD2_ACOCL|nr:Microtubule-associated protein 70-5 [Acorus calamus]
MVGFDEFGENKVYFSPPDPVALELNRLQDQLKEKERELGAANSEIKALKATEILKDKAMLELSDQVKKLDERIRGTEKLLEDKNLEVKKLNSEKKEALSAQFAVEAALRRVHTAQKDEDFVFIEDIIAPLESEIKMYKKEEENRILERTNRQKVVEIERLTDTILELDESILASGAAANAVRDYQRRIFELSEEKKTLGRELARVKVSANRVATVVANEWKEENDKVMPVKQWLEERRFMQGEMQRIRDKLALAERTAKAEAELKERLRLRLKTLEEGLKHGLSFSISSNATPIFSQVGKSENASGAFPRNPSLKKRSNSQPRASCTTNVPSCTTNRTSASNINLTGSLKRVDSLKKTFVTENKPTSDNDGQDLVSGYLYDRLQREIINIRKLLGEKDEMLNAKDDEIEVLLRKVDAVTKIMESESRKMRREAASKEKDVVSTKLEENKQKSRNTDTSKRYEQRDSYVFTQTKTTETTTMELPRRAAVVAALSALILSSCYCYYQYRSENLPWKKKKKTQRPKKGLLECIGDTPLIRIDSLSNATGCEILAKAEFLNPGGSVKDRVARKIIEEALDSGDLVRGGIVIEGSAGSTAISLATVAPAYGCKCHVVIPDDVAIEKSQILEALGATVERVRPVSITHRDHFVNVARRRALEATKIASEQRETHKSEADVHENGHTFQKVDHQVFTTDCKGGFFADQFENLANFRAHYEWTGPEIWEQTGGYLHAFVAAAGTGGTLAGVSRFLQEKNPNVKCFLIDPPGSGLFNKVTRGVMYTKEEAEGRRLKNPFDTITEGIGINRLTKNFMMAKLDGAYRGTDLEAVEMSRFLLRNDGLFVGSSSAMNCVGAVRVAQTLGPGHTIVTILCDSGMRHLSKFYNSQYLVDLGLTPSAKALEFLVPA